jgi:two-component system, chemotaxis family, CheB/CheR fusion protein
MATSKRRAATRPSGTRPARGGARASAPDDASMERAVEAPGLVVIACSAAGLPACRELLGALPERTGLAFVVVLHPDGEAPADPVAALSTATPMPVRTAETDAFLVADTVWVLHGQDDWILEGGKLQRSDKLQYRAMPVDLFLRSAAATLPVPTVVAVLNGVSTDGTLGLEAVKAEGAVTFAQAVDGSSADSMPRSASVSGAADFVMTPAAIGAEIATLAAKLPLDATQPLAEEAERVRDEDLRRIYAQVRLARGVDFSQYRQTTLRRRIMRRMLLQRVSTLADYVEYLRRHPQELDALFQDMLIRVTSFFRDPEVFDLLKTRVFPELMRDRAADDPVRIWVPGCASGEEAYSLAIALLEGMSSDVRAATPLQLFATDISEAAIERARAGIYPSNVATDISAERLRRYFVKVDGGYQIDKSIRDMCVFARQNVTSDPPFSRIDMVSCRNLLIYLEPALQRKVIPIFHYALKRSGFLLLGNSETTGASADLFTVIDKRYKIYVKSRLATPALDFGTGPARLPEAGGERRLGMRDPIIDIDRDVDRAIMSRYAPPGVVIDEDHQIIQFRGYTGAYLEPAPGEASLGLFKMAREGLTIELRAALHRAQTTQEAARTGVLSVRSESGRRDVVVQVLPLRGGRPPAEPARHYLVLFETPPTPDGAGAHSAASAPSEPEAASLVERLKHELASTREYLQAIIEEQEATNEELQSANEEILSSNEELQSINEELETAKEELQSTNEELTTVNDELQSRNQELVTANNDLHNSLASINLPIVMLTSDMRIRRFTPMAERALHLIPTDIGRPLGDIKPKIDVADLEQTVREVLASMTERNQLVKDSAGRRYAMRIRPYRTGDNRVEGAVIYLVDMDELAQVTASASA